MINPKRLIEMARKWQKISAMGRRRISLPRSDGHFVVYTIDKKRFVVPLRYLNHNIFRELFRMSEEEFGLPGDGPITLPCDAFFMEYVVLLVRGCVSKASHISMAACRCSISSLSNQEQGNQQILLHGF